MAVMLAMSSFEMLRFKPAYSSKDSTTDRIRAVASAGEISCSTTRSSSTRKNSFSVMKRTTRARLRPSTRALTVPSGRRRSWSTLPMVPISLMSSAPGLSMPAFFWVARNTVLSPFIASVRALTERVRPTKSGATMWGKTTMSRKGRSGSTRRLGWGSPSLKNFGIVTMIHSTVELQSRAQAPGLIDGWFIPVARRRGGQTRNRGGRGNTPAPAARRSPSDALHPGRAPLAAVRPVFWLVRRAGSDLPCSARHRR